MSMSYQQFNELTRALESKYSLFSKLWELSRPVMDPTLSFKTAAVSFNKIGDCIHFVMHPDCLNKSTPEELLFIVSHECLHVILNHGYRINGLTPIEMPYSNVALDVVINHSLVNFFGFDRKTADPTNKLCWLDTVFKPVDAALPNQSYEYYFALLKQKYNVDELRDMYVKLINDHSALQKMDSSDFYKYLSGKLTPEDADALEKAECSTAGKGGQVAGRKGGQVAGTGTSSLSAKLVFEKPKTKVKWETVIKKWASKRIVERTIDQWAKESRRHSMLDKTLMLPAEDDIEVDSRDKMDVWFFLDTSGSCVDYATRFFKAAATLSPERFNLRLFCFDTEVYPTTLASKTVYGWGGTTFSCIEAYIQKETRGKLGSYPKAVFLITDGYGDYVCPKIPQRWYWFLTEDYKYCIPKESKTFMLSEYE